MTENARYQANTVFFQKAACESVNVTNRERTFLSVFSKSARPHCVIMLKLHWFYLLWILGKTSRQFDEADRWRSRLSNASEAAPATASLPFWPLPVAVYGTHAD